MFRFNYRKHPDKSPMTDAERFAIAMSQVARKRLTYSELTDRETDSLHHEAAGTVQTQPQPLP